MNLQGQYFQPITGHRDYITEFVKHPLNRYRYHLLLAPIFGLGIFLAVMKQTALTLIWIQNRLYHGNGGYKDILVKHEDTQPVNANRTEEHRPEGAQGFTQQQQGEEGDPDGDHHTGNGNHERNEPHLSGAEVGWARVLEKYRELDARLRVLEGKEHDSTPDQT